MSKEKKDTKKKGKGKLIIVLVLTLLLGGGAAIGSFLLWQNMGYLTTDNARVTTNLINITTPMGGTLERLDIYEGQTVTQNQILGWAAHGEAIRSPIDGLVVHTTAVEGQVLNAGEIIAVIADINNIHIVANIEETDIAQLQRGLAVTVTIDGLGNEEFSGYISEIGRITSAELSGNAVFFNTGGNFTRVTHLIPIEITITDPVNLENLIGTNATVRIPLRDNVPQATPAALNMQGVSTRGIVESVTSRNIYSSLGSNIESVYVEVGDEVTEGQVLAVLNVEDLEFAIAQQRVALTLARQNSQIAVGDAQRMLNEATANLENNTNMRILHAETALSAAEVHLLEVQRNRDVALQDYEDGSDMQILSAEIALQNAESALISARADLAALEETTERLQIMYDAGFLPREELRQSELALAAARSRYNDAQTAHANAATAQGHTLVQQSRSLEITETMLQSANVAVQNAQILLSAERAAAQQEIESLRSILANTQAATNVEQLEIALRQLERQLEESVITAPVNGTITAAHAREGAAGIGLMFVIEDIDTLKITTSFREYDIGRLEVGMEVIITASGTGNTEHRGIISRINPAAVPNSPIVEFEAEITVTTQNSGLRIGMTTRIDVIFEGGLTR